MSAAALLDAPVSGGRGGVPASCDLAPPAPPQRQFYKVADCIPYASVLAELEAQPELWNGDTRRQDADGSPHRGAPDIWLRYRAREELREPGDFILPFIPVWYPAWRRLPSLHPIIYALSGMFRAVQIGGVLITRIPPGGRILPHHDRGSWHAEFFRQKVYLPLQSNPACVNECEGEAACMMPGECWTFDNLRTHSVRNDGDQDRITVIACFRVEP